MTGAELAAYIGRTGKITTQTERLILCINVIDAKTAYGSIRLRVQPAYHSEDQRENPAAWVLADRVRLDDNS